LSWFSPGRDRLGLGHALKSVLVTFWSLGPVGVVTMRAWPVFGRGSWPVAASPYGPARGPLPRAKPMPGRVSRLVLLLAGQASPSRRGAPRKNRGSG
jgi:hypothetical protein